MEAESERAGLKKNKKEKKLQNAGTDKKVDLLLKVKRHHKAFTAAENTNLDSSQSKYSNIRASQEHYGKEQ